MKKVAKITAIVLGCILVLMLLLPFAFRGKIEGLVKTEGNKMLNAQFDFNRLDISLFRNFPKASIVLKDFWLKGVGEFENDTLVRASEIAATIDIASLFGDSGYEITKVSLKNISAKAIVLDDGKVNWDVMKSDSTETVVEEEGASESSPFKIQLKKLTVDNLNVIYDDRQSKMYADIKEMDAVCSGDLGSEQTTLKLESNIKSLTYKMEGIPFLNNAVIYANMDIDADLVNNKFTFSKNEFRLNAIKAGIDGWVAMQDPAMDMDLKLVTDEVGFKELLSLVPAIYASDFKGLKTDGVVTLSAQAKGIMQGDTLPQFNVVMDVKNAMFQYPSLPAGVDQINIHAEVTNPGGSADLTEIVVNPFNFRLAGNTFGLTADVKTPVSDANFKAEAKGKLDLGKIKEVYPLEDMALNGIVNADLAVAGRMSYIEKEQYEKVQASGSVSLTDMLLTMKDMPDVKILKSLLTFTPQYLQLSETTVNIGDNDITLDSRFENYMAYALQNKTLKGNLNVSSNHFNLNDFMGDAEEEAAQATTDTTAMSIILIPDNIDFTMTANMKEVLFDNITLNTLKGNLTVKGSKVNMSNLSMNTLDGALVMNGYYSTVNAEKPELNATFKMNELSFAKTYEASNMVRQLAPIFENLKGTFSGNMTILTDLDGEMSPVLETMQGSGNLSTKDLSLSGVDIIDKIAEATGKSDLKNITAKDLSVDFAIKDGRLSTNPFDIKWNDYVMNVSGSTGLDQTVDYTGTITLPASVSNKYVSSLGLKIGGTFTSPKVSIDTESMAKQAVDAVKDQALEKVAEKLGLDSTASASVDAIKEEVKEKAVEKATDALKGLLNKKK